MALLQTQTAPSSHSHGFRLKTHNYSPIVLSFHGSLPSLPVTLSAVKTHHQNSLFSTINTPLSLSTVTRKLLCRPPHGKHVREDYLVKKMSAQEVQELVKGERNVPLIVDFFATWCGPCILMAQELEMLAVEYESNVKIIKVDTDDEYEFARDMQNQECILFAIVTPMAMAKRVHVVQEYEKMEKRKREENLQQQEPAEFLMLDKPGRVEEIEILNGIADMTDEVASFLASP